MSEAVEETKLSMGTASEITFSQHSSHTELSNTNPLQEEVSVKEELILEVSQTSPGDISDGKDLCNEHIMTISQVQGSIDETITVDPEFSTKNRPNIEAVVDDPSSESPDKTTASISVAKEMDVVENFANETSEVINIGRSSSENVEDIVDTEDAMEAESPEGLCEVIADVVVNNRSEADVSETAILEVVSESVAEVNVGGTLETIASEESAKGSDFLAVNDLLETIVSDSFSEAIGDIGDNDADNDNLMDFAMKDSAEAIDIDVAVIDDSEAVVSDDILEDATVKDANGDKYHLARITAGFDADSEAVATEIIGRGVSTQITSSIDEEAASEAIVSVVFSEKVTPDNVLELVVTDTNSVVVAIVDPSEVVTAITAEDVPGASVICATSEIVAGADTKYVSNTIISDATSQAIVAGIISEKNLDVGVMDTITEVVVDDASESIITNVTEAIIVVEHPSEILSDVAIDVTSIIEEDMIPSVQSQKCEPSKQVMNNTECRESQLPLMGAISVPVESPIKNDLSVVQSNVKSQLSEENTHSISSSPESEPLFTLNRVAELAGEAGSFCHNSALSALSWTELLKSSSDLSALHVQVSTFVSDPFDDSTRRTLLNTLAARILNEKRSADNLLAAYASAAAFATVGQTNSNNVNIERQRLLIDNWWRQEFQHSYLSGTRMTLLAQWYVSVVEAAAIATFFPVSVEDSKESKGSLRVSTSELDDAVTRFLMSGEVDVPLSFPSSVSSVELGNLNRGAGFGRGWLLATCYYECWLGGGAYAPQRLLRRSAELFEWTAAIPDWDVVVAYETASAEFNESKLAEPSDDMCKPAHKEDDSDGDQCGEDDVQGLCSISTLESSELSMDSTLYIPDDLTPLGFSPVQSNLRQSSTTSFRLSASFQANGESFLHRSSAKSLRQMLLSSSGNCCQQCGASLSIISKDENEVCEPGTVSQEFNLGLRVAPMVSELAESTVVSVVATAVGNLLNEGDDVVVSTVVPMTPQRTLSTNIVTSSERVVCFTGLCSACSGLLLSDSASTQSPEPVSRPASHRHHNSKTEASTERILFPTYSEYPPTRDSMENDDFLESDIPSHRSPTDPSQIYELVSSYISAGKLPPPSLFLWHGKFSSSPPKMIPSIESPRNIPGGYFGDTQERHGPGESFLYWIAYLRSSLYSGDYVRSLRILEHLLRVMGSDGPVGGLLCVLVATICQLRGRYERAEVCLIHAFRMAANQLRSLPILLESKNGAQQDERYVRHQIAEALPFDDSSLHVFIQRNHALRCLDERFPSAEYPLELIVKSRLLLGLQAAHAPLVAPCLLFSETFSSVEERSWSLRNSRKFGNFHIRKRELRRYQLLWEAAAKRAESAQLFHLSADLYGAILSTSPITRVQSKPTGQLPGKTTMHNGNNKTPLEELLSSLPQDEENISSPEDEENVISPQDEEKVISPQDEEEVPSLHEFSSPVAPLQEIPIRHRVSLFVSFIISAIRAGLLNAAYRGSLQAIEAYPQGTSAHSWFYNIASYLQRHEASEIKDASHGTLIGVTAALAAEHTSRSHNSSDENVLSNEINYDVDSSAMLVSGEQSPSSSFVRENETTSQLSGNLNLSTASGLGNVVSNKPLNSSVEKDTITIASEHEQTTIAAEIDTATDVTISDSTPPNVTKGASSAEFSLSPEKYLSDTLFSLRNGVLDLLFVPRAVIALQTAIRGRIARRRMENIRLVATGVSTIHIIEEDSDDEEVELPLQTDNGIEYNSWNSDDSDDDVSFSNQSDDDDSQRSYSDDETIPNEHLEPIPEIDTVYSYGIDELAVKLTDSFIDQAISAILRDLSPISIFEPQNTRNDDLIILSDYPTDSIQAEELPNSDTALALERQRIAEEAAIKAEQAVAEAIAEQKRLFAEIALATAAKATAEREAKEAEEKVTFLHRTIRETEERIAREAEKRAVRDAEEQAVRDAEEQAVRDAEEQAVRDAEEQAVRDAEEQAVRDAEEQAVRDAEEQAVRDAEEQAVRDAEEQAVRDAEEQAVRDAEEQAVRDAEEQAVRDAEEQAVRDAEEQAVRDAEEQAVRDAEEQAVRDAEEQAVRDAEEQAVRDAEEQAVRDAEEQAVRYDREDEVREAEERSLMRNADVDVEDGYHCSPRSGSVTSTDSPRSTCEDIYANPSPNSPVSVKKEILSEKTEKTQPSISSAKTINMSASSTDASGDIDSTEASTALAAINATALAAIAVAQFLQQDAMLTPRSSSETHNEQEYTGTYNWPALRDVPNAFGKPAAAWHSSSCINSPQKDTAATSKKYPEASTERNPQSNSDWGTNDLIWMRSAANFSPVKRSGPIMEHASPISSAAAAYLASPSIASSIFAPLSTPSSTPLRVSENTKGHSSSRSAGVHTGHRRGNPALLADPNSQAALRANLVTSSTTQCNTYFGDSFTPHPATTASLFAATAAVSTILPLSMDENSFHVQNSTTVDPTSIDSENVYMDQTDFIGTSSGAFDPMSNNSLDSPTLDHAASTAAEWFSNEEFSPSTTFLGPGAPLPPLLGSLYTSVNRIQPAASSEVILADFPPPSAAARQLQRATLLSTRGPTSTMSTAPITALNSSLWSTGAGTGAMHRGVDDSDTIESNLKSSSLLRHSRNRQKDRLPTHANGQRLANLSITSSSIPSIDSDYWPDNGYSPFNDSLGGPSEIMQSSQLITASLSSPSLDSSRSPTKQLRRLTASALGLPASATDDASYESLPAIAQRSIARDIRRLGFTPRGMALPQLPTTTTFEEPSSPGGVNDFEYDIRFAATDPADEDEPSTAAIPLVSTSRFPSRPSTRGLPVSRQSQRPHDTTSDRPVGEVVSRVSESLWNRAALWQTTLQNFLDSHATNLSSNPSSAWSSPQPKFAAGSAISAARSNRQHLTQLAKQLATLRRSLNTQFAVVAKTSRHSANSSRNSSNVGGTSVMSLTTDELIFALALTDGSVGDVLARLCEEPLQFRADLRLACGLLDVRAAVCAMPGGERLYT